MRDKLMDNGEGTATESVVYPKPESSWGQRLDKRTTILQAASVCFLHKGYAETSLDEIVAQSGVVKQTIYNYFENKDALFRAALEHMMSGTRVVFDPSLYKLPPQEFFQRVGKELLGILSEIKTMAFLRLLVKECRRFPELQFVYAEAIPKPFIEFVRGYIEKTCLTGVDVTPEVRAAVQATSWYFRSALTGFATLSNLAPMLKFSLPNRTKYLNVVSGLFARYLEVATEKKWKFDESERSGAVVNESETSSSSKDFLQSQLGNLGQKKLSIIEAAIRTISERGFAESSMDDIAAAAGTTKQTVYKHFGNKNFMYSYIANCIIDELQSKALPDSNLPLSEFISQYCSSFVTQARQPWIREYFRLVFGESQAFPMESGIFLIYIMDNARDHIESKIREQYGEEIDSLSISLVLRSIMGGFVLLSQIYVMGDNPFLSEATLQSINRDLLHCLQEQQV